MSLIDAIHKIEQDALAFINWTEEEFKQLAKYIADCLEDKDAEVIANELVKEFEQLQADLMADNHILSDIIAIVTILSKLHNTKEGLDVVIQLLTKLNNDYVALCDKVV